MNSDCLACFDESQPRDILSLGHPDDEAPASVQHRRLRGGPSYAAVALTQIAAAHNTWRFSLASGWP